MIELVVTMIIIGILAVAALPRMVGRGDFDPTAFRDATLALLRYAQKSAIAQRRDVCVTFAATSTTLSMASAHGDGSACAGTLAGPNGATPATAVAPSASTGFSATPASFRFHARGDTDLAANLGISVTGTTNTITVERATGYVH